MIDFDNVSKIVTPAGEATELKIGGVKVWGQSEPFTLITPEDTTRYPLERNDVKIYTLTGSASEEWFVYSSNRARPNGVTIPRDTSDYTFAVCPDFDFEPTNIGGSAPANHHFNIAGINLPIFRLDGISSALETWISYVQANNIKILSKAKEPDGKTWKPAIRNADGVTGYWDGEEDFIAEYGGIPYVQ